MLHTSTRRHKKENMVARNTLNRAQRQSLQDLVAEHINLQTGEYTGEMTDYKVINDWDKKNTKKVTLSNVKAARKKLVHLHHVPTSEEASARLREQARVTATMNNLDGSTEKVTLNGARVPPSLTLEERLVALETFAKEFRSSMQTQVDALRAEIRKKKYKKK